jgi:hypothetical protein
MKLIPASGTSGRGPLAFRYQQAELSEASFKQVVQGAVGLWGKPALRNLVLNCYPSGISLPESIPHIEIGAKEEVLRLAVEQWGAAVPGWILLSQPHFAMWCLFSGVFPVAELSRLKLGLGGSWSSIALEQALAKISGTPVAPVLSLFGVAELGLGIGTEGPREHAYRVEHALNKTFASELGVDAPSVPMIFAADPSRFFLEIEDSKLLVTGLDARSHVPLIRYEIGDRSSWVDELSTAETQVFSVQEREVKGASIRPGRVWDLLLSSADAGWFEILYPWFEISTDRIAFFCKRPVSERFVAQLHAKLKTSRIELCERRPQVDFLRKSEMQR